MSSHEEPESQIDPTHTQYAEDYGLSPKFSEVAHAQAQNSPQPLPNINESDSDEKILDTATGATSSPTSQDKVFDSQILVEETQFTRVEQDTQPSVEYDLSPISRRALDNIEPVSTRLPPSMADFQPLERRSIPPVPKGSNFRFARPLNSNEIKFVRQLSGQAGPRDNETADTAPLMTTSNLASSSSSARSPLITNLHDRGSPISISHAKNVYSNPPATQNDISCRPGYEGAVSGEVNEFVPQRNRGRRAESPFESPIMQEGVSSRTSRQSVVKSDEMATGTMRAQLVATLKSNKLTHPSPYGPSQLWRTTKPRSPPFVEEAFGSDIRHKSRQIANKQVATEDPSSGLSKPGISMDREVHKQKADCTNTCSLSNSGSNTNISERLLAKISPMESEITARDLIDGSSLAMPREVEIIRPGALVGKILDSGQPLHQNISTNEPVSSIRQSNDSIKTHGQNKSTLSDSVSRRQINKPLPLLEVSRFHSIRNSLDAQTYNREPAKSKSAHRLQTIDQTVSGDQPPDSAAMLQMAAILATAEKEQRDQGLARSQLQELEIEDLRRDNAGFRDRIEVLSTENRELLNKIDDFRRRNERCRTKMNEITRAHKELFPAAKALDKRRFEMLTECAKEMDAELLKKKALLSVEWKSLFSEARIKLDNQDKMIELLSRDVDNRLLDLQRERNIKENLQRQLEDREKQEKELSSLLLAHQQSIIEALSGHEHKFRGLVNTGATSLIKLLNECRAGIENIEESESKPMTALVEVRELIIAMSKSIKENLQGRKDFSIDLRTAGAQVLEELRNSLQLVGDDYVAQKKLDAAIVVLREENRGLIERIESQKREFVGLKTEIGELKSELQHCRAELTTKNDDLGKAVIAVQAEATLRSQLENLQTNCSIEVHSATQETERVKATLLEQENLALLAQQEISNLRDTLAEREAKISSFHAQKEAYILQAKTEFATLRLQMERDLQTRLVEDNISHNDKISGLRRQVAEANGNVENTNRKAQNLETLNLRHEIERNHLSIQLSAVAMELTMFKDKSGLLDQRREQIDLDLRTSQNQLSQCAGRISDFGSQNEIKALEFANRCDEIEDGIKRSGTVAEAEIERLRRSLSALQKNVQDSNNISTGVARQLHNKGVLNSDLVLVEWAKQLSEGCCQQEYTGGEICHATRSDHDSPCSDHQGRAIILNSPGVGEDMTKIIPNCLCEQVSVQDVSRGEDRSFSILDDIRKDSSRENHQLPSSPLLTAPNGNESRDVLENEDDQKTRSVAATTAPKSPSRINEQSSVQETISTSISELNARLDHSKIHPSDKKKLQKIIGPVIADSQEEITRQALNYTPRVPEHQFCTPHIQEAKRTVTASENIEYSTHSSEVYRDISIVQSDLKNGVRFGDRRIDVEHKKKEDYSGSDHESSGLSDPPDALENLDFTEYLDDFSGRDQKTQKLLQISSRETQAGVIPTHSMLATRPNTSRIRTGVDGKDIKPPKSILKRPSSKTGNDISNNADPSEKPFKPTRFSKPRNSNGAGMTRMLLRTSSGTSEIHSAKFSSSYNRVVSGNRTSQNSNYFQIPELVPEEQGTSGTDSFSPVMGQPQRNSKKRTLSGADLSYHKKAAKVPRLDVD